MKALAVAIVSSAALAACGSAAQPAGAAVHGQTPMAMPSASAAAAPAGPPQATNAVLIKNYAFSPAAISVKAGTTVTWTNDDQDAHTVSFLGGAEGGRISQPLQMGDAYTHTFTTPGTISYICSIHPFMRGTVVVTP